MLAARDARRDQQAALLKKYASPLICFTLNIAGPEKRDALIDRAFADGVQRIEDQLRLRGVPVLDVQKKVAFTGDTLFHGSIGRTDFKGGSMFQIINSLRFLAQLPDEVRVLPGHGQATSIGEELAHNPYMDR